MNCPVCLCVKQPTDCIKCIECNTYTCIDCTDSWIECCIDNGKIPDCVVDKCKCMSLYAGYILGSKTGVVLPLKNVKNTGKDAKAVESSLAIDLADMLKKKLLAFYDKELVSAAVIDDFIAEQRRKRQEFITTLFPEAIKHCVNLALSKRLLTVQRNNNKLQDIAPSKKCANVLCKGLLDSDGKCKKCSTVFCLDCDKKLVSGTVHVCNQTDLESVEYIKSMIKCPKCNSPVEKKPNSCNDMKCSACGTNFDYATGRLGGHGNTHNKQHELKNEYSLSQLWSKEYTTRMLNTLKRFENLNPVAPDIKGLQKLLRNDADAMVIAKKYFSVEKCASLNRIYAKMIDSIQEAHLNNTLTGTVVDSLRLNFETLRS